MSLDSIQKKISYTFNDIRLLKNALTHRSYLNEKTKDPSINEHNERLEFLGDAVLELVVSEYLFVNSHGDEGVMTSLRSSLVNYKLIGQVGKDIGLQHEIFLSKGEKEELGKARLSIVADAFESLIGAIYLDGGYEPACSFIKQFILTKLDYILATKSYKDFKTTIQEYTQSKLKITPQYKVISSEGKDHEKLFHIGLWLEDMLIAEGSGRSKQEAETEAAKIAYGIIKERLEKEEQNLPSL
jgi:ribonuclease III